MNCKIRDFKSCLSARSYTRTQEYYIENFTDFIVDEYLYLGLTVQKSIVRLLLILSNLSNRFLVKTIHRHDNIINQELFKETLKSNKKKKFN